MVVMAVIPAAGVVRRQKAIVALFEAAGATSADHASTAAALRVPEGRAFELLKSHAVLQEAGEQRLYLDAARWQALQARRRRLGLVCAIIAVSVILAFAAFGMASR